MARIFDLDLRPDDRTLRSFGFIALAGFGVLALLAWQEWAIFAFGLGSWRSGLAASLLGIGLLAGTLSLVWPRGNWPIYVGLTLVAFPIGFVLSYVILGGLFYLLIMPIGLLMRAVGYDPMHRKIDRSAESYWVEARAARKPESYFRQF